MEVQEKKSLKGDSTIKFVTLGCKVNQYETQGMSESVSKNATDITGSQDSCDFVVVNTCTVTSEADKNNRYWIRRMKRENPGAQILVTGCYVEKNRDEIKAMPEVDMVLTHYEKDKVSDVLFGGCADEEIQKRSSKKEFADLPISKSPGGRARAYVKVQDGCNHACSFCKIVLVRGRSRSREEQSVVDEVVRLRDAGYREIVFAGIQLGAYGLEYEDKEVFLNPSSREHYYLSNLIERCAEVEGIERIRLSSIEPTDIGAPLIETFKSVSKFCPQMHIPLQSGDTGILAVMNRRYSREYYIDLIARLKSEIPDFTLTLDVMAGFPGEDARAFENTIDLLEKVKPLKCHVFPYSSREGTKASVLEDIPSSVSKSRVKTLLSLSERLGADVMSSYKGRVLEVLVEKKTEINGHLYEGYTANYIRVVFQSPVNVVGSIVPVQLIEIQGGVFLGKCMSV